MSLCFRAVHVHVITEFPTSKLEMTAVADIFDRDGDGYIDYYEFVAALHPNKDAYRPTTDADKIEDEARSTYQIPSYSQLPFVTLYKVLFLIFSPCRSPDKWPSASVRRGSRLSRLGRTNTG